MAQQLISKLTKDFNNKLKLSSNEKPNYYAKIFEQTLWLPKLMGTKLSSNEPVKSPVEKTSLIQETAPEIKIEASTNMENTTQQSQKVEIPEVRPVVKIEVEKKPASSTVKINKSFNNFISQFNENWKVETIPGYKDYQGEIDIIFFGLDEIEESELPDFLPLSMIESTQDIMGRMIKAMNITSGRFIRIPYIKKNAKEFIFSCCAHFRPRLLVPLGASATKLCLDKQVRLANVHGIFHSIQIEVDGKTQVIETMPLFHPKLLEVNESMKKTAWADMQKAIKFLTS